MIVDTCIK